MIDANDLANLSACRRVRLLDAKRRVIGEAQLGAFHSHGASARSDLVEHIDAGEPYYVELLGDDGRVIHTGPVSAPLDVPALVDIFRRALNGGDR